MKKIVFLVCLAAIMVLSGCTAASSGVSVTPEPYHNAYTNSQLADSLIAKVKNSSETKTFEGFTGKSTVWDCLASIKSDGDVSAKIYSGSELLGYPAVVECIFNNKISEKPLLAGMNFTIYPRDEENVQDPGSEILSKLDEVLGARKSDSPAGDKPGFVFDDDGQGGGIYYYGDDYSHYVWEKDGLEAEMYFYGYSDLHSSFARMTVTVSEDADTFPGTPEFFPCRLGQDAAAVYEILKPCKLPEGAVPYYSLLNYDADGINIGMSFKTDDAGEIKLSAGNYSAYYLNDMEPDESINYYESVADSLEGVIGASASRGYDVPDVNSYENGIPKEWGIEIAQRLSLQELLDSGSKYYFLSMTWPGIGFTAEYVDKPHMNLQFWIQPE